MGSPNPADAGCDATPTIVTWRGAASSSRESEMRSGWPTTGSVSSKRVMKASLTTTAVVAAASALVRARPRSRRRPDTSKKSPATLTASVDRPASGGSPERQTRTLPLENGPLVVYAMPRTRPSARMRASNASRKARRSAGPYLRCTSKRSSVTSVCGACGGTSPMAIDEAACKDTRGEQQQEAERHLRDDQAAAQARVARRHRAPAAAQMRRGVRTGRDEPGQQARCADHQQRRAPR